MIIPSLEKGIIGMRNLEGYFIYMSLAAANGVMARVTETLSSQIIYTIVAFVWLAGSGLALGNCIKSSK